MYTAHQHCPNVSTIAHHAAEPAKSPPHATVLVVGLFAASLLATSGCKNQSKEDKLRGVCERIYKDDLANCAGDAACEAEAARLRDGCNNVAKTVGSSKPIPSMASQIAEVKGKCNKGDQEACSNFGAAIMLGDVPDQVPSAGFTLASKSCESGNANGCEIVGRAYDKGITVAVDKTKYNEYMKRACDLGAGGGCRSFAMSFATTDQQRIPLLEKACEKNDPIGCVGVGAAFLHGQGTTIDKAVAKRYFQKACDLKSDTKVCELARSL